MILKFQGKNKRRILLLLLLLVSLIGRVQGETPNAQQARRIFNIAYNRVYGCEGSKLKYDVNIIGLYKAKGTIWMKGKKKKFIDARATSWNDGNTVYKAYCKKKIVEIYDANSDKNDKYTGRFKFTLDDFDYSIAKDPEGLMVTLKQKKKAKGTIKEVRALLNPSTYDPIRLRIKVALIWTTIKISEFQTGGISDDIFVFPKSQYKAKRWQFVDKR